MKKTQLIFAWGCPQPTTTVVYDCSRIKVITEKQYK